MLKKVDVHYLCIKDFHLPLKSTDEEIAAFHAKCRSFGVTGYGVGPIYMGSEEEVNNAFAYAKRVGVKTLVGVPFSMVERSASRRPSCLKRDQRESPGVRHEIRHPQPWAGHAGTVPQRRKRHGTHQGPGQARGALPGHRPRIAGRQGPGERRYSSFADRIHDIHIKNVTAADKSGRGIEMPRGAIDMPAFVRALRKVRYTRRVQPGIREGHGQSAHRHCRVDRLFPGSHGCYALTKPARLLPGWVVASVRPYCEE